VEKLQLTYCENSNHSITVEETTIDLAVEASSVLLRINLQ